MLQCYNRGCGQQFDPARNAEDSCRHHPGMPFFHDAYKGWSCCSRKTVNFTEFLNMKGCSLSKHSNVKPPEPEKSPEQEIEEEVVMPKPIIVAIDRPPFDTSLTKITPVVLPSLKAAIDALPSKQLVKKDASGKVEIGTICKNGGCKCSYTSPDSDESQCRHHPGVPIFHEGMKYWSCCQKKTSDFTAFMDQKGCTYGNHRWKDDKDENTVNCRYDWHQTASEVIVAIYAKLYHYENSSIELNPIRLKVKIVFPDQNEAIYNLDIELLGVVDVENVSAKMFSTKIEITMPKAEPGKWSNLNCPRFEAKESQWECSKLTPTAPKNVSDSDSDIDLDDVELHR